MLGGDHCPVQGEENAVGWGLAVIGEDAVDHLIDNGIVHRPGRSGPGHHGRDWLVAVPSGAFNKTAKLVVSIFPDWNDIRARCEGTLLKPLPVRGGGSEGIRF